MLFSLASTGHDVATPADLPDDLVWVAAVIPGGVHESLIAAGQIPHPYQDEHEDDVRWVEDRVWWYRASFEASPGRQRLVLPRVDTTVEGEGLELQAFIGKALARQSTLVRLGTGKQAFDDAKPQVWAPPPPEGELEGRLHHRGDDHAHQAPKP